MERKIRTSIKRGWNNRTRHCALAAIAMAEKILHNHSMGICFLKGVGIAHGKTLTDKFGKLDPFFLQTFPTVINLQKTSFVLQNIDSLKQVAIPKCFSPCTCHHIKVQKTSGPGERLLGLGPNLMPYSILSIIRSSSPRPLFSLSHLGQLRAGA